MLTYNQFLVIRVVHKGEVVSAQEIFRQVHDRIRKDGFHVLLHRLVEMGVLGTSLVDERSRQRKYWLTDVGERAFECCSFLDSLSHRGRRWDSGGTRSEYRDDQG